jgi:predicted transcriptional regulator
MPEEDQRQRNEEGQYESKHGVSKEDVFKAMEIHEPYTSGELAEELDAPRRTIYNYLEQLANENRITKKKPEPRRAIWFRGA